MGKISLPEVVGILVGKEVGTMNFLYVALNPLEVKKLFDLKRTTMVLVGEMSCCGLNSQQNLPVEIKWLFM